MTLKKKKIAQISIILLMVLSLLLSVKFYKVSTDFDKYVENSDLEQKVLESQLSEILYKYDSISIKSKIDSLRFEEQLKLAQTNLFAQKNAKINSIDDAIVNNAKNEQSKKAIGLSVLKAERNTISKIKTSQLTALNVTAKGVKIYSDSYKMSESKIQQLRVCFTLEENQMAHSGNKTVYVQVVNPKNQIISSGNTFIESSNNTKLQYSASVNANYQKKDTDVCTYVDLEKNKTIKGKYKINIYHDFVKIGTTIFEY
ncbi:hypothetical protein GFJ94_05150 [Flavobacterium sp. LMO8]|uniref:hypothetical protein n=1 Tax=Flavobacterium sp. LMO8 TaxID=2654244 RepID=UPI0012915E13|nr:hypothetical protein [Flavobacterium sp. LMO8]MQP24445.1 hypothetical protein [Flavobacterium sp. LMO8]